MNSYFIKGYGAPALEFRSTIDIVDLNIDDKILSVAFFCRPH